MRKRIRNFLFLNTTPSQTVAKNTFWLFVSQIGSRFLRAIVLIYATRVLGAEGSGIFSYALSLAAMFTIFTDFGINAIITRESSRDHRAQQKYFSTGLAIKITMLLVAAVLLMIFGPIIVKQYEVVALLPLVIFVVGFDSMRDFGLALARGFEKMEIEGIVQLITNSLILVAGFVALHISATPRSFTWGYVVATAIGMAAAFVPYRRYFMRIRETFSWSLIKPILSSSWPFGMVTLMTSILLNTDTIMIGWYRSIADVGYYAAAQRIALLIYILPGPFTSAVFPSMSKLVSDTSKFRAVLERSASLMLLLGLPLTIGGFLVGGNIMRLVYGNAFDPGSMSFKIMCLTLIPSFLSVIFANAIFALNRERKLLGYVLLGVTGNFVFNLVLIPHFGIAGAALSTFINQTIITSYLFVILRRAAPFHVFRHAWKVVVASLLMGAVVLTLQTFGASIYLVIVSAIILYFGLLAILKEETLNDVRQVLGRAFGR